MSGNFIQVMPCEHCGCVGYHMWAGSGLCPGLVEGVEKLHNGKMPESMYYYQTGFKAGWEAAKAILPPQPQPRTETEDTDVQP